MASLIALCETFRSGVLEYILGLSSYELGQICEHRSHEGLYIFRDQMGPLRVGQSKDVGARMSSQKNWVKEAVLIERAYRENMSFDDDTTADGTVKRAGAFLRAKGIYPEIRFSVLMKKDLQEAGMTLNVAEGLIQWAIRPFLNVTKEQTLLLHQRELGPSPWESCCTCSCHYSRAEYCRECVGIHISGLRMALKDAMFVIDTLNPHQSDKR